MKILHILAQKPSQTGSGVFLASLLNSYDKMGFNEALIAGIYKDDNISFPKNTKFYKAVFKSKDFPFEIFGMSDEMPYPSKKYSDMSKQEEQIFVNSFENLVKKAILEFKPDLILSHHLYFLSSLIKKLAPNIPVFAFCHNTDLRQMKKHNLRKDEIIKGINELDYILIPKKDMKNEILQIYGTNEEKIKLINSAYDENIFHKKPKNKNDKLILFYAGKISEKKGVKSLIKSLKYLNLSKNEFKLFLAGGAGNVKEYEEILNLAKNSSFDIEFLGKLNPNEMADFYNKADIFILPSFSEGLPLVVVEALACGSKVVVSELPGLRAWANENIKNANISYVKLPRMKNVDEPFSEDLEDFEKNIAEAITQIKEEKLANLDLSNLTWESLAKNILDLYNDFDHR